MLNVRQIRIKTGQNEAPRDQFPFSVPALRDLDELSLDAPVVFFVGANGAGKSTLLEAVAGASRLPTLTSRADVPSGLAAHITLVRSKPIRHGFFFRADDVTGFIERLKRDVSEFGEIEQQLNTIEGDWGRTRATAMARGQADALKAKYGEDPTARSHGELFLDLFAARITAPGLYLMDEPETPLSPANQITLLAMIGDAVDNGSQFVIATHAPILMAYPGARIYDFDQHPPAATAWEDLEHVQLTRAFLNHPERYLRHLYTDA